MLQHAPNCSCPDCELDRSITCCMGCDDLFIDTTICEECGCCEHCCNCAAQQRTDDDNDDEWDDCPYFDEDPRSWDWSRARKRYARIEARLDALGL